MKKIYWFIFLFFLFPHSIFSVQKGSESNVTIEPLAIFPSDDADNIMMGFGWFKNGFVLEDSSTSCTFDSVFPVSGSVVFNGGTLYLNSDLHLANITTITSVGTINGQHHIFKIDSSVERLFNSDDDIFLKDIDVFLHSDLQFSTTVRFDGDCYLNGRDRRVNLDDDIEVLVGPDSTLHIKNINIVGVSRNKIRCIDNSGKIVLDNASLVLDGNYNFTIGNVEVLNYTDVSGSYTFFYDCLQTLTINSNSIFKFRDGITLALGVNNNLPKERIFYFEDQSSRLWVENANVHSGSSGILITRGSLVLVGRIDIDIDSTDTTNGVILGDGTQEGDFLAEFTPASHINFKNGHVIYNEYDPNKFVSKSTYSKLIRGISNVFHIERDQRFSDVTISVEADSALTVADGTEVHYENCKMIMPGVKFFITGSRYNTYTSLLDGDEEIFLQEGTLPLYTVVKNSGNLISGNGNISGGITLYDDDAELDFSLNGNLENNITFLLGGNVVLLNDIRFIKDKNFVGAGTVDLNDSVLSFGSMDQNLTNSIYFDGNSCGCLEMNSDLSLYSSWTFSGNCQIKGNNNIITMKPTGQIIIERGSTLEFKDIRIAGLSETNIKCLDDFGKIIFDGVRTKQSGDYSFEKGSLEVDYFFDVKGEYTFSYKSTQQSTVKRCALWSFFPGTTFSYCPANNSSNLINLSCEESELCFDDSTLHSTTTGLNLTRGSLNIRGNCLLKSDATSKSEGIVFGDGVLQDNDLKINVYPESILELASGYLVYKNLG